MNRGVKLLPLVFVLVLAVLGCGTANKVAMVNGEPITKAEFDLRVKKMKVVYEVEGQKIDQKVLEKQVLDALIEEKVIAQAAKEEGVEASTERAKQEVAMVKQNFPTDADWKAILESRHLTEDDMVKYYQSKLVAEGLMDKLGGEQQYQKYIQTKRDKAKVEVE